MKDFKFEWTWRSVAAIVYLVICLTDFVFMPVYREYTYTKLTISQMVTLASTLEGSAAQVEALKVLKDDRTWVPITNDMFHLSFGAILGVAALPRNRRSRPKKYDPMLEEEDEDDYYEPKPRKSRPRKDIPRFGEEPTEDEV